VCPLAVQSLDVAGVKQFLEKQHAAVPDRVQRSRQAEGRRTDSYLFAGANVDALMQALDPAAPGPVPYTGSSIRF
jgi:hypothetical protein